MKIIDKSVYTFSKDNPPFCTAKSGDVLDITADDVGFVCFMGEAGPLYDICELRTCMMPIVDGCVQFKDISWPIDPMGASWGRRPQRVRWPPITPETTAATWIARRALLSRFRTDPNVKNSLPGMHPKKYKKIPETLRFQGFCWSEWRDLNSRPLDPQSSALPTAPHPDESA